MMGAYKDAIEEHVAEERRMRETQAAAHTNCQECGSTETCGSKNCALYWARKGEA